MKLHRDQCHFAIAVRDELVPPTKGLTIRQPWASQIIDGSKRFEYRSWMSESIIGQRIAIHAGARRDKPGSQPTSAIIGSAIVAAVSGNEEEGYAWRMDDPVPCEPLYRKGALSLWRLTEREVAYLADSLLRRSK